MFLSGPRGVRGGGGLEGGDAHSGGDVDELELAGGSARVVLAAQLGEGRGHGLGEGALDPRQRLRAQVDPVVDDLALRALP